jgi:hypothetical protein
VLLPLSDGEARARRSEQVPVDMLHVLRVPQAGELASGSRAAATLPSSCTTRHWVPGLQTKQPTQAPLTFDPHAPWTFRGTSVIETAAASVCRGRERPPHRYRCKSARVLSQASREFRSGELAAGQFPAPKQPQEPPTRHMFPDGLCVQSMPCPRGAAVRCATSHARPRSNKQNPPATGPFPGLPQKALQTPSIAGRRSVRADDARTARSTARGVREPADAAPLLQQPSATARVPAPQALSQAPLLWLQD